MYGIQIAFRDFKANRGYWGSEWVGLAWFQRFFSAPNSGRMIKNTVLLSLYSLLWSFPVPIVLALMINQVRFARFKRTVQTVLYAPHFISIMVVCGMIRIFLSPSGGLINLIAGTSIDFLTESSMFRTIYIASGIWQDAGWGIIIYMATLANIDTSQYEAAKMSGGYAELNKLTELIKFASIFVAAAPMLAVYPFVQKYFEKGFMAGAVKG